MWVIAKVYSLFGEYRGELTITSSFFRGKIERGGECALLSRNTSEECLQNGTHNIMVIEWDVIIAYRKGLGTLKEDVLATVETKSRRIVLG